MKKVCIITNFLCTPAPKTMFKNINKLEAGTWISFDEKGKREKKILGSITR